jgi:hypothetical protein
MYPKKQILPVLKGSVYVAFTLKNALVVPHAVELWKGNTEPASEAGEADYIKLYIICGSCCSISLV